MWQQVLAALLSAIASILPPALVSGLSSLPAVVGGEIAAGSSAPWLTEGSSTSSALTAGTALVTSRNPADTLPDPAAGAAELRSLRHMGGERYEFTAYSAAMDREVRNEILLPGGLENTQPRPSFYLMMGADGAAGGWSWANSSGAEDFFLGKNVNVVTPKGSVSSMQANWYEKDPTTGTNQWATYLTRELPLLVDAHFHGTGRDAIAGMSMSGGPAIRLAAQAPERFVAAGSYSGCPSTEGMLGSGYTAMAVGMNGADIDNMWGSSTDAAWHLNNPAASINLEALRDHDVAVFVGAAHGNPGEIDKADGLHDQLGPPRYIEMSSYVCSRYFTSEAKTAGVDVTSHFVPEGTHSWGLFEYMMRQSWDSTIGPALGVEAG